MPIVNMPLDVLVGQVNRGGAAVITAADVPDKLHDMGVEVDEITATQQYQCARCSRVIERTAAQGAPLLCPNCGADFRAEPGELRELGEVAVARLDMLAVRPDIFDAGGMGRYFRGFLDVQPGLIEYAVAPPKLRVKVDPALGRDDSYRPFIACAVLRDVRLDNERIKLLMNLQEDLHWALGRNRKLASIGVYDLSKLGQLDQPLRYDAVAPDELRFTPLGWSLDDPAAKLTPGEVLERHKTGQAFAFLLKDHKRYPLLRDAAGTVLSMPPIINSEDTRVTLETRACFVDVTGLSRRTVDRALAIIVANLLELMPEMTVEQVTIDGIDGERVTPDLTPVEMRLGVREAAETVGVAFDAERVAHLLERMGHGVVAGGSDALTVRVPAWRNDIMHPIDLIEDIAIAYGYQNLAAELVPTFTVGDPRPIEEQSAVVRRVFTGLGFHQVMTLVLTSEPAAFGKWRLPVDERCVKIEHPISTEQTIARVSLLPGLLETLAINKQYDLPQTIFEVGDCSFFDPETETGAREERYAAAAMIGTHVGYADIRAVADALAFELGRDVQVEADEHPSFLAGRCAALVAGGARVGVMGEVHPEVLEAYGLKHATAVLEVSVARLLAT